MPKRKRKLVRGDVHLLESMGFSEETAKAALRAEGNVQDALNSLLSLNGEEGANSHLISQPKRRRSISPVVSGNELSENTEEKSEPGEESIEDKHEEVHPRTRGSPEKLPADPVFTNSQIDDLVRKYEAVKERYEKDRTKLVKERDKINEKVTWLKPRCTRFNLVKSTENWLKDDDDNERVLWFKKQWLDEEKLINTELEQYQNQLAMFDEELKYIDHIFQQKTIQFENEKTVAELVSKDMKSGQRMNADDRNMLLLSSAGKELRDEYSCTICFCEYEVKDFAFLSCMHGFCRSCLKMMISTKVKEGKLHILYCPNVDDEGKNCKHRLTHEEVRLFIGDHELFSKYERLQLHQTLNQTEDCRWCPRPGCETAMFGDKTTPMMTCPKCEMKFCFNCKTSEWHKGTSCQQFQQWKKENSQGDAKFDSWKNKNTSPCPKCKSSIEKAGGCMHMTCLNCKYEWHWLTGEKWKGYQAQYAAPWQENPQPEGAHNDLAYAARHDFADQNIRVGAAQWLRQIVNIFGNH